MVMKKSATKPMVNVHRDVQRDGMETRAIYSVVLDVQERHVTNKVELVCV